MRGERRESHLILLSPDLKADSRNGCQDWLLYSNIVDSNTDTKGCVHIQLKGSSHWSDKQYRHLNLLKQASDELKSKLRFWYLYYLLWVTGCNVVMVTIASAPLTFLAPDTSHICSSLNNVRTLMTIVTWSSTLSSFLIGQIGRIKPLDWWRDPRECQPIITCPHIDNKFASN